MAFNILIPKLGMNVSEVNIVEWKVAEGAKVDEGDVLVVIETQKTEWNIEAGAAGFVHILKQEGQGTVGEVIGAIAETKEELESLQKGAGPGVDASTFVTPKTAAKKEAPAEASEAETAGGRIKITPVARKMAEEHMIDVSKIKGTGPGGRITREDIEQVMAAKAEKPAEAAAAPAAVPSELLMGRKVKERIHLRGMRKAISDHMFRSLASAAQMTVMGELDMTGTVRLREGYVAKEKAIGVRISYTDIIVYILSRALKELPDVNCSMVENDLILWDEINIGVAAAVGAEGLVVPVIKGADRLSLAEISRAIRTNNENAQTGKLKPDDLSGGTFTLTSMGRMAVSYFQTPILNQPEAAILATGGMIDKPVVREGQIVVAPVMPYSLTFDHRVINGFGAERFMGRVRELIESPGLMFL